MKNRYEVMKGLRDHLNELFRMCGVSETHIELSPSPALIRLAEKLVRDDALCVYLEGLDTYARLAVRSMQDRRLDDWNYQQNEDRIVQLEKQQFAAIQDLITLRDKLLLRKSWLEEEVPEEENARKLVASQLRETARCLTNQGVEILEAGGAFDNRCQTAVETRPAPCPEQAGQIAETFRPGYRFRNEILRPQEVILFTAS